MRNVKINYNFKTNFFFFLKMIRENLRSILIAIIVLHPFLSSSFLEKKKEISFEEEINLCKTVEEIDNFGNSILEIIYNEENVNYSKEEINLETKEKSDQKDELKREYLKKIKNFIKERRINIENFDLKLEKKNKIWKKNKFFSSATIKDPKKTLIISPINRISKIICNSFFEKKEDLDLIFFLDLLIKITICNILVLIVTENKDVKKMVERGDEIKIRDIEDIFIALWIKLFLIRDSSLTYNTLPPFVEKIATWKWWTLTIAISNIIPYIMCTKSFVYSEFLLAALFNLIINKILKTNRRDNLIFLLDLFVNDLIILSLKKIRKFFYKTLYAKKE